jgi:hypothetical protein
MSTKIWIAYRIPKIRINEFIDIIHDAYMKAVADWIEKLMSAVEQTALEEFVNSKYAFMSFKADLSNPKIERQARIDFVLNHIERASVLREKSIFDIDCGITLWLDRRYAYIIPQPPNCTVDTIKFPEWVEDFHYQNQVDRPEEISEREWKARERKWDELCLGVSEEKNAWNARKLYHAIVDMSPPYHHSFMDLEFYLGRFQGLKVNE